MMKNLGKAEHSGDGLIVNFWQLKSTDDLKKFANIIES